MCVLVSLLLTNKSPADVAASGDNDFLAPVVSGDAEWRKQSTEHRFSLVSAVRAELVAEHITGGASGSLPLIAL